MIFGSTHSKHKTRLLDLRFLFYQNLNVFPLVHLLPFQENFMIEYMYWLHALVALFNTEYVGTLITLLNLDGEFIMSYPPNEIHFDTFVIGLYVFVINL